MLKVVFLGLFLITFNSLAYAECDSAVPAEELNDCDLDGVTVGDGDCDDDNDQISPDLDEQCNDEIDNNCSGELDEGCEGFPEGATLLGGGQCGLGIGGSWLTWLLLVSVIRVRREST
jgi:hypothetical protein